MKIRKEITLPSGAVVTLRPPRMLDVMTLGEAPKGAQALLEWQVSANRLALLKCTGRLRYPDGKSVHVVDKPFDECREDEVTIEDLEDGDAIEILKAIGEMRKEAALAVAKFPAQPSTPEGTAHAGQNGQTLQETALGIAYPD